MRTIDSAERRARLARRHRLAAEAPADDPVDAARSVVCLHATDPATVHLSAWARVEAFEVADLERALYEERTLVKHMAMRRTLFVVPTDDLGIVQGAAGDRVAGQERRRLCKQVEGAGLFDDGEGWLARAEREVLAALGGGREASSSELRAELPVLEGAITFGEGKSWGGEVPIGPRVLNVLHASGRIVRASNDGRWTASRPLWAETGDWLGGELHPPEPGEALRELVGRWLFAFGPGTEADIVWWLGGTKTAVRKALADVGAVEVELDGGATGYALADDLDPVDPVEPWAALLAGLDPTPMGWVERDWYLGAHAAELVDRNGNIGASAWWDGRMVGGWRQDADGAVELQLLEDVGGEGASALEREAERLTEWLDGTRIAPRFPSPLSKA